MNRDLCDAGSRIHKISSTFSKVIGDGGEGGHSASVFYSVKLCVMISFSLRHNVLCFSFVVVLYAMYSLYAIIKVVLINSLLQKLSNHCYAILINSLSLPAPSFADDVTLLALFPSFLKTFLNICHQCSVTWRYEFNHTKSGVVTFGETKPIHSRLMKEREWTLGDTKVDELYEYKNLGVLKNDAGSFTSNILDNIEKTRGMIFSSDFDRRKTKPLIYIKFWKQACLPCLLFGAELFSLNKSQLCQLERCQQWFLKNVFYVPKFAPGLHLLKISNLNSIESEIDLKNLLFLGRLITEPNMSAVVKGLFCSRAASFFRLTLPLLGYYQALVKPLINMIYSIIFSRGF